jgi:hypothetical protein
LVWFGGGEVDIILHDIQCNGSEDNLLQCIHGIEVHNCFYYEAAGISCGNLCMYHIHNTEATALLKWVPLLQVLSYMCQFNSLWVLNWGAGRHSKS